MAADPQYIANVEGDLPRIMIVRGDIHSEDITTQCTGCGEETTFSWRQWKGDFTGNFSDFEQFCNWATWYASLHECFLAGRVGYIVEPPDIVEDDLVYDPLDHNCPTCGRSAAGGG